MYICVLKFPKMSQTLVNRKRAQFLSLRGGNELGYFTRIFHYLTGGCVLGFLGAAGIEKGVTFTLHCCVSGVGLMI